MAARAIAPLPLSRRGYVGTGVNSRNWNIAMVDTDPRTGEHTQFCGFVGDINAQRRMVIAKRTISDGSDGAWQRFATPFNNETFEDVHNVVSLMCRQNGRLCVSFGMHDVPLKMADLRTVGSIALVRKYVNPVVSGSTIETSNTYPAFGRFSNGDEIFTFREGGSGDGNHGVYFRANGSDTWQSRVAVLFSGESTRNFYPIGSPHVDANDVVHIAGCWRESSSNWTTNHDILYIYSEDKGQNWKWADGTAVTVPITVSNSNAKRAWVIPSNSGMTNNFALAADGNSIPCIITVYGAAPAQLYAHYWSGALGGSGSWARTTVGTETGMFSWVDDTGPSQAPWVGVPSLVWRDGVWRAYFWSNARGSALYCGRSTDLATWSVSTADATRDWRGCYGNYDRTAWRKYGRLYMYHQDFQASSGIATVPRIALP